MYIYVTLWVIIQHYVTILLDFSQLWELRGSFNLALLFLWHASSYRGVFGEYFLTFWYYVSSTFLVFFPTIKLIISTKSPVFFFFIEEWCCFAFYDLLSSHIISLWFRESQRPIKFKAEEHRLNVLMKEQKGVIVRRISAWDIITAIFGKEKLSKVVKISKWEGKTWAKTLREWGIQPCSYLWEECSR